MAKNLKSEEKLESPGKIREAILREEARSKNQVKSEGGVIVERSR